MIVNPFVRPVDGKWASGTKSDTIRKRLRCIFNMDLHCFEWMNSRITYLLRIYWICVFFFHSRIVCCYVCVVNLFAICARNVDDLNYWLLTAGSRTGVCSNWICVHAIVRAIVAIYLLIYFSYKVYFHWNLWCCIAEYKTMKFPQIS